MLNQSKVFKNNFIVPTKKETETERYPM